MSDRTKPHASSVTIRRNARAPFCSSTATTRCLCRAPGACAPTARPAADSSLSPSSPRVSGCHDLLRASSPIHGLSCDAPRSTIPMRTDRFLLPTAFNYEHSCLVRSRLLFEARASPLGWWTCIHDQETGEPGVSRRPIRFGGPLRFHAEAFFFLALPLGRTSDTPVASPVDVARFRVVDASWSRQDRFAHPSVTMRCALRARMSSVDEGTPALLRGSSPVAMRSRDVFRNDPVLSAHLLARAA